MDEQWQLYNEQGRPLAGKGAIKSEVFSKGLLHAASHLWIWRGHDDKVEILVQKRADGKLTWPGRYDISAAGHIDLGEDPITAALREAKEEINLGITEQQLRHVGVHRAYMLTTNAIENEFQYLYTLQLDEDATFTPQQSEVHSVVWIPLSQFKSYCNTDQYVPHGEIYYSMVISAIQPL